MRFTGLRVITLGLMISAFIAGSPGVSAEGAGTVVGQITCGADETAPAPHIVVAAEGLQLQTLTDDTGRFTLFDVPAQQPISIEAIADPQASVTVSRDNLVVQPGETLDIGSMDLAVCGQPAPPPADDNNIFVTDR